MWVGTSCRDSLWNWSCWGLQASRQVESSVQTAHQESCSRRTEKQQRPDDRRPGGPGDNRAFVQVCLWKLLSLDTFCKFFATHPVTIRKFGGFQVRARSQWDAGDMSSFNLAPFDGLEDPATLSCPGPSPMRVTTQDCSEVGLDPYTHRPSITPGGPRHWTQPELSPTNLWDFRVHSCNISLSVSHYKTKCWCVWVSRWECWHLGFLLTRAQLWALKSRGKGSLPGVSFQDCSAVGH